MRKNLSESSGNCLRISSELMKIDSKCIHVRCTSNQEFITWSAILNFCCQLETSSRKNATNLEVIKFCSCTFNTRVKTNQSSCLLKNVVFLRKLSVLRIWNIMLGLTMSNILFEIYDTFWYWIVILYKYIIYILGVPIFEILMSHYLILFNIIRN